MPKGVWDRTKSKEQRAAEKTGAAVKAAPKAAKAAKPAKKQVKAKKVVVKTGAAQGTVKPAIEEVRERVILLTDILANGIHAYDHLSRISMGMGDGVAKIIKGCVDRLALELENISVLPAAPVVEQAPVVESEERPLPAPVVAPAAAPVPPALPFNPPAPVETPTT